MTQVLYASTSLEHVWGGPKRYVAIVVHETIDEFQKSARRYEERMDWDSTIGAFHPTLYRERHINGKWVNTSTKHYAGTIRLSLPHCLDEVVTHECVHAAATIFRMDVRPIVNLGRDCFQNEEFFAYITGDLTARVAEALVDAKIWPLAPF